MTRPITHRQCTLRRRDNFGVVQTRTELVPADLAKLGQPMRYDEATWYVIEVAKKPLQEKAT